MFLFKRKPVQIISYLAIYDETAEDPSEVFGKIDDLYGIQIENGAWRIYITGRNTCYWRLVDSRHYQFKFKDGTVITIPPAESDEEPREIAMRQLTDFIENDGPSIEADDIMELIF